MSKTGFKIGTLAVIAVVLLVSVRFFETTVEIFAYGAIFGGAMVAGSILAVKHGKGPLPSKWWKFR